MTHRIVSARRGGTVRRQSTWFSIGFSAVTVTSMGTFTSLNAAALALRPFTVVRTHVELYILSDQAAAHEFQATAFGMAVVSDQAAAVGVTAIPMPVDELGSDLWFVHRVAFADATALTDVTTPGQAYSIDSKAMRKVSGDEDIVISQQLSLVGSGASMLFAGRMLIKIH